MEEFKRYVQYKMDNNHNKLWKIYLYKKLIKIFKLNLKKIDHY